MKKLTITVISISLIALYSFMRVNNEDDTKEGIQFFTATFQQALDQAKRQNKLVFMDAYASWCGPCKMMKHKTFKNKNVADFYNKNFINIAVDMEKGEGPALSQTFQIEAYPTLIFVNPQGKLVAKAMGYHKANDFLELGEELINKK